MLAATPTDRTAGEPRFTLHTGTAQTTTRFMRAYIHAYNRVCFATASVSGTVSLFSCQSASRAAVPVPGALWTASLVAEAPLTHGGECTALAVNAADNVVVGSERGELAVFATDAGDANNGGASVKLLASRLLDGGPITTLSVGQNGEITSASQNGMIAFTDMADPGLPTRESIAQADSAAITGITWRSLHDLAYCTDAGRIGLVDRRIPKVVSTFHDLQNEWVPLNCIAVHPTQNTTLATGDADGQVKVWDLRNTKQPEVRSFGMHSSDVWDVVFPSTNAFTIASASQDGTLAHFTWNENNPDGFGASSKTIGLKEKRISGRGFSVNGIDCHPEVPLVVAVGDGGQVVLTDL